MAPRVSQPSRRGLRGFLDDHPLPSLLGLCVSVATVIAGIMTYYSSQRSDAVETCHKAELIDLAAKNKTDLFEATSPLKQTIADLTFRISSIERRIPGTGPVYLDVSTISAGPETIKALSSKYKTFDGGDFYLAIPEMGNWSYLETTELDFISSIYSFMGPLRAQFQKLGDFEVTPLARQIRDQISGEHDRHGRCNVHVLPGFDHSKGHGRTRKNSYGGIERYDGSKGNLVEGLVEGTSQIHRPAPQRDSCRQ